MSLESMQRRLTYQGGSAQQDRMIKEKLRSMLSATKYSYQAARFSEYPALDKEYRGLFNPVTQTESFDTKMVSVPYDTNYKVGSIFQWKNTDTLWIIFLQDKTELAYFRGECRRCDYKVNWVDGDRQLQEALMSVIGPTTPSLRTSSSMQAKVAEDFPNSNLKILIQDNDTNRAFFFRYQVFLIQGIAYKIEEVDTLSMPGIIQLNATEHYANLMEDDVEENVRNAWNVQPIVPTHLTDYMIDGPSTVKPYFEAGFEALTTGGQWVIVENMNRTDGKGIPTKFVEYDNTGKTIHVFWDSPKSGGYTIGYQTANGQLYQRYVVVESMM